MDDVVLRRRLTALEQTAEQIGADLADAVATHDYHLLYERMIANIESLEFEVDCLGGKLIKSPQQVAERG